MRDRGADDAQILICERPLFSQFSNTVQLAGQIAGRVVLANCVAIRSREQPDKDSIVKPMAQWQRSACISGAMNCLNVKVHTRCSVVSSVE